MALSIKKQAESLLIKNEYKPITELEMAEYIGFNDKEKTMLKLFWDSTFNESMLYLSDELIINHMVENIDRHSVRNFIDRIFLPNFKENEHYIKIDKNHELIKIYYNSDASNLTHQKNYNKIINKRYFAITGTCFKELLIFYLPLLKTKFLAAVG